MSAIKQALIRLNGSLQNLENSIANAENTPQGGQRDMFGAHNPAPSNQNDVNVALVAQRLDIAIEKVEEILSEAKAG